MKEVVEALAVSLESEIQKNKPEYVISIKKVSDGFYAIGDHLDEIDARNVWHGGLKASNFLLFATQNKSHTLHLSSWRNNDIFLEENFRHFTEILLPGLFEDLDFEGYLTFYGCLGKASKKEEKFYILGEKHKKIIAIAESFPHFSKHLYPGAESYWEYHEYASFDLVLEEEGVFVRDRHSTYGFLPDLIKSEKDISNLLNRIDSLIEDLEELKRNLHEDFPEVFKSRKLKLSIGIKDGKFIFRTSLKEADYEHETIQSLYNKIRLNLLFF